MAKKQPKKQVKTTQSSDGRATLAGPGKTFGRGKAPNAFLRRRGF